MASAELLKQIQSGRALKKAVTNDRSVPQIDAKKPGAGAGGRGGAGVGSTATTPGRSNGASSSPATAVGGPPQLGGLFAGGMPKLKPAATTTTSKYSTMFLVSIERKANADDQQKRLALRNPRLFHVLLPLLLLPQLIHRHHPQSVHSTSRLALHPVCPELPHRRSPR
jgi:WH2 motif